MCGSIISLALCFECQTFSWSCVDANSRWRFLCLLQWNGIHHEEFVFYLCARYLSLFKESSNHFLLGKHPWMEDLLHFVDQCVNVLYRGPCPDGKGESDRVNDSFRKARVRQRVVSQSKSGTGHLLIVTINLQSGFG